MYKIYYYGQTLSSATGLVGVSIGLAKNKLEQTAMSNTPIKPHHNNLIR